MDRNLALEFVRVTEAAAIAAAKWIGRGQGKKALGPFKNKIWTQEAKYKDDTLAALKKQFEYLFTQLNLFNTTKWIET